MSGNCQDLGAQKTAVSQGLDRCPQAGQVALTKHAEGLRCCGEFCPCNQPSAVFLVDGGEWQAETFEALRFGAEYAILCPRHGAWCVFRGLGDQEHDGMVVHLVDSGLQ